MTDNLDAPNLTAHNEIQKLRANFCNGCGIAAVAAGLIIPVLTQMQSSDWLGWGRVAAFGICGVGIGLLCHSIGRIYVFKIKE